MTGKPAMARKIHAFRTFSLRQVGNLPRLSLRHQAMPSNGGDDQTVFRDGHHGPRSTNLAPCDHVNTLLNYSVANVGIDCCSALDLNDVTTLNLCIAAPRRRGSGGKVDAFGNFSFVTTFNDSIALADASFVSLQMSFNSLSFGYEALTGAEAGPIVNFNSSAEINPPEFRVISEDYRLDTGNGRTDFGSTGENRTTRELVGVGPNASLGPVGLRATRRRHAA
jgi:hypothetical protein